MIYKGIFKREDKGFELIDQNVFIKRDYIGYLNVCVCILIILLSNVVAPSVGKSQNTLRSL